MTAPPTALTYASVVSRESVRIMLTIAALNGLEVLSSDIQNAYLIQLQQKKRFGQLIVARNSEEKTVERELSLFEPYMA
jgi:hypothetical protein